MGKISRTGFALLIQIVRLSTINYNEKYYTYSYSHSRTAKWTFIDMALKITIGYKIQ
jgi:hypothetical protein